MFCVLCSGVRNALSMPQVRIAWSGAARWGMQGGVPPCSRRRRESRIFILSWRCLTATASERNRFMAFDLAVWRAETQQIITDFAHDPRAALARAGTNTLYGMLLGSTLLPLVAAYASDPKAA